MKIRLSQKGQALPIGIAAMLFVTLLGLLVFNTSQTTSEKMRLTNTADAAVYSGMIWQARALNFHGYTNRAMVANQVAIAQVVSFVSWSKYLRIAARNLNAAIGWFPPATGFTNAFYQAAMQINNYMAQFSAYIIQGLDMLIEVISISQEIVHYASIAAMVDVVLAVVEQNDPTYEVTTAGGLAITESLFDWVDGFSEVYDHNKGFNRKAEIIMRSNRDSRDGWTRARGWSEGFSVEFAGIGAGLEIVKGGETKLLGDGDMDSTSDSDAEWEWKAKDTLSFHLTWTCWKSKRWGGGWWGTCNQEIPMAWGAAFTSTTGEDFEDTASNCVVCQETAWTRNRYAEEWANYEIDNLDGYEGIRSYRDIAGLADDDSDTDPRHTLALEVKKPNGARTSSQIDGLGSPSDAQQGQSRNGIQTGMFSMPDNYNSGFISALSKAELYFRRPDGFVMVDGARRTEYGNLFNPYWDVHLVDVTEVERLIAWGLR